MARLTLFEVADLAGKILAQPGLSGWKVDGEFWDSGVYIANPAIGARLLIQEDKKDGRLNISTLYPGDARSDGDITRTVAIDRGPRAAADTITKRLLPDYLPRLRDCLDQQDRHKKAEDGTTATVSRLAGLPGAGGKVLWGGTVVGYDAPGGVSVDARVSYGGSSVKVTVDHASPALAEQIIRLATQQEVSE